MPAHQALFRHSLPPTPAFTRLLLNFEGSGSAAFTDAVTGELFVPDADPDPPIITASGKFGQGLNIAGTPGDGSGKGIVRSINSYLSWDLLSEDIDWTISLWARATGALDSGSSDTLLYIQTVPHDSNTFITIEAVGGGVPTIRAYVPSSDTLLAQCIANWTVDSAWHFIVFARIGDAIYLSIDGAAATGPAVSSASYRHPPGPRRVEIGNSNTNPTGRRFPGVLDAIEFFVGTKYDVVSGFTPPVTPPVLV